MTSKFYIKEDSAFGNGIRIFRIDTDDVIHIHYIYEYEISYMNPGRPKRWRKYGWHDLPKGCREMTQEETFLALL